MMNIQE